MIPLVVLMSDRHQVPLAELETRLSRLRSAPERIARAVVVLRERDLATGVRRDLAERLLANCQSVGAQLAVADDLALAQRLGCGLHLPTHRAAELPALRRLVGAGAWLSVGAHRVAEVAERALAGASCVLLSPIFVSPGKAEPLGLEALAAARARLTHVANACQLVALGGVGDDQITPCLDAGADGVAAIRADLVRSVLGDPSLDARARPC